MSNKKAKAQLPKRVKPDDVHYYTQLDGETFRLPKKFKLIETRGQGSYGVVVSAKNTETGEMVALKKNKNVYPVYFPFKKTGNQVIVDGNHHHRSVTTQKRILRELKILIHIGTHPNIVSLINTILPPSFEKFSDVYFIMDLMECDLKTIIESDQDLTHEHQRFFMYQILMALNFIHSASVLHRDLKPENILLNSDCELKLCDFGLARYIEQNQDMSTSFVVSRWYRSPELLLCNQKINTGTIDIWSTGCIFAELLGKRKVLFPGVNPVDQLQKILMVVGTPSKADCKQTCDSEEAKRFVSNFKGIKRINFRQKFPKAEPLALDLLDKMLQFNPFKRITAAEALRHPYFKSYFIQQDVEKKPSAFNYQFEKINDSRSLKLECYNSIVKFYQKQKRGTHMKKLKKSYAKINEDKLSESPISFNGLSPGSPEPKSL